MKRKLCIIFILFCCVAGLFADDDEVFAEYTNESGLTQVYLPSKNQKFSLEEAVALAMEAAAICVCNNGHYSAKIYKNKKALLSSPDFKDEDIYGTALSAVTKEHYGEAQIFFRGYDGGYANLVDWDFLALYALDDGRFMCVKILDDLEELEK